MTFERSNPSFRILAFMSVSIFSGSTVCGCWPRTIVARKATRKRAKSFVFIRGDISHSPQIRRQPKNGISDDWPQQCRDRPVKPSLSCSFLNNVVERMVLISEQPLTFGGIEPVGRIRLQTECLLCKARPQSQRLHCLIEVV